MLKVLKIEKAKPRKKLYKLWDGNGLFLIIKPDGKKQWRFRYRFGDKESLLGFGTFPEVSLAKAREQRDDARLLLRQGVNPAAQKKAQKLAAIANSVNTFKSVAEEYLDRLRDENRAPKTISKVDWMLLDLAKPLHGRPMREILPGEILPILKKIEKRGKRETARRLRGTLGAVFRFAIANLKADTDPTAALKGALLQPVVTHRAAITDETKLGRLMVAIDEYDGSASVKAGLQFLALTMARPGEVRLMRRFEVNFIKARWDIPAGRMKQRVAHDVPLSRQALDVLRSAWDRSTEDGYVFPARRVVRALSDAAFNVALRRMGYSKNEVSAHGFRSSASTILNERGYASDVIEAALGHQDEDEVRAAYNRARYWEQRKKLLQDWADLLDGFKVISPTAARA